MNCEEIRELLDPLVDGELRDIEAESVNRHVQRCRDCRKARAELVELRGVLAAVPAHQTPEWLEQSVANNLFGENSGHPPRRSVRGRNGAVDQRAGKESQDRYSPWLLAGSHLAAAMLGMLVFFGITQISVEPDEVTVDASTLVNLHVRALVNDQPAQILAGEPHDVKPWFAGRIDYSPPVRDFAKEGFPLVGGRVDSVDGQLIAVLVYKRRKHWISVLVAPHATGGSPGDDRAGQRSGRETIDHVTHRGYQVAVGRHGDFEYQVISDLNRAELSQLVRLLSSNR